MRRLTPSALSAVLWLLGVFCLGAAPLPEEMDLRPVETGVSVSGLVAPEYEEGLLIQADDGAVYLVLTPEEVSLEAEEAFHKARKGQRVTLSGDVYRDEDGALSLFVKTLPPPGAP